MTSDKVDSIDRIDRDKIKEKVDSKTVILVIDDEDEIRTALKEILSERYDVLCAASGSEGLKIALEANPRPSLILVDIYMNNGDGIFFCNELRSRASIQDIPVMMMTAMDAKDTRIRAFDAGADDYLAKPFDVDELHSRLHAKLRWSKERQLRAVGTGSMLALGDVHLDLLRSEGRIGERNLDLGFIEFKILWAMGGRRGQLVTRSEIEEVIWGKELPATRSLDTHIASLRKKLACSQLTLRTVYGSGYVLE